MLAGCTLQLYHGVDSILETETWIANVEEEMGVMSVLVVVERAGGFVRNGRHARSSARPHFVVGSRRCTVLGFDLGRAYGAQPGEKTGK